MTAEDFLYPKMAPNLPPIVLGLDLPSAPSAAGQLRILARARAAPSVDAKLRYGLALWSLRRRVSAERQFDGRGRARSGEAPSRERRPPSERFTKRDPVRAFGRLGPLTGAFPQAAVVRLHLGALLLWTGEVRKAAAQFRLAVRDEPRSPFATAARQFISIIPGTGTK